MASHLNRLRDILRANDGCMAALRSVRAQDLPQGAIGAGLIRTAVWDAITQTGPTPVDDIDVVYFDPTDTRREAESTIERKLLTTAALPWSVRNQARMHLRNGDAPYLDLEDALRHWLETPTCVAVRLTPADDLEIVAPYGLDDLFAMRIRPTLSGRQRAEDYRSRIEKKDWSARWPQAVIEMP